MATHQQPILKTLSVMETMIRLTSLNMIKKLSENYFKSRQINLVPYLFPVRSDIEPYKYIYDLNIEEDENALVSNVQKFVIMYFTICNEIEKHASKPSFIYTEWQIHNLGFTAPKIWTFKYVVMFKEHTRLPQDIQNDDISFVLFSRSNLITRLLLNGVEVVPNISYVIPAIELEHIPLIVYKSENGDYTVDGLQDWESIVQNKLHKKRVYLKWDITMSDETLAKAVIELTIYAKTDTPRDDVQVLYKIEEQPNTVEIQDELCKLITKITIK